MSMSENQLIILGSMLIYFLLMIVIGIFAGSKQDHEGFVIGNRNVGYIPTIGSLASSFRDGLGIMFWFGFAILAGYGGLWLFVGVIVGLFFYATFGPKIRDLAEENNFITIGEIIKSRIGAVTEKSTALIIIIFSLMLVAVQLYVAGNMFSTILDADAAVGVWSVALVVGFYLFFGGYSSVVKTDAIQFFIILSLISIPFFFAPPKEEVMAFETIFSLSIRDNIALVFIGLFFVLSSADTWQKVFSARDKKVIRRSFPLASIFLLIMTFSLIFLGFASKPFLEGDVDTKTAFFQIFSGDFMPVALQAYIAVVVMAVCMSTLDTLCYLTSATIAKNYLPARVSESRDNYILISRAIMIFVLLFMGICALAISDVILFAFDALSLLYILAPVYIVSVLNLVKNKNRSTDFYITFATILSCLVYLYMFMQGYFADMILIMVPVAVNIVLISGFLFYTKYKKV